MKDSKTIDTGILFREFSSVKRKYRSDWTEAQGHLVALFGAAVSIFSTSLMTSIAFGLFYQVDTKGVMGIAASLASGGITGVIQALFGGNPMTVAGQTGPVSIVYSYCYRFANGQNIPFLPWVGWIGVWTCILHMLTGYLGLCRYRVIITPFTGQIFEMLVAADFITTGIRNLVDEFRNTSDGRLNGVLGLLLGFGYVVLALILQRSRKWSFTSRGMTKVLAIFSAFIALVVFVLFSWFPFWTVEGWPLDLPQRPGIGAEWGRPGLNMNIIVDMGEVPVGFVFAAIIPAIMLTVLFYVDHNISSMAAYGEDYNFEKPTHYDFDFFILGLSALVCGLLGLPASSGLIPQNPMHSRACLHFDKDKNHRVIDQRISPLIHSLLLLVMLLVLPAIEWIPTCLIWSFFLVLATEAFSAHNEFFCRVMFLVTSKQLIRNNWNFVFLDVVPGDVIMRFTLLQLSCFIFVYMLAVGLVLVGGHEAMWPVIGVSFPVAILLFAVPFRSKFMKKWFLEEHLLVLDSSEALVRDDIEIESYPEDELEPEYEGRGAQLRQHVVEYNEVEAMVEKAEHERIASDSTSVAQSRNEIRARHVSREMTSM